MAKNNKNISKIKREIRTKNLLLILLMLISLSLFACRETEQKNINTASPSPTPEKKTDDFQGSLADVRTGNFSYILAFRRTDGGVFSGDDKKFIKANAPNDTNQWVMTADEKVIIAGSNYKFTAEHLDALKKRFTIEDFSPQPVNEGNGNINQNVSGDVPSPKPPVANGNQNSANTK